MIFLKQKYINKKLPLAIERIFVDMVYVSVSNLKDCELLLSYWN